MGARIRLRRVGRKKQASYRIVVAEQSAARDGAYVESIGFYNPRRQPAELRLDLERVDYWLGNGALPTETTKELILKARKGGDAKVKLYAGEEQPEKETSPTAVRARRSERTKPKMKVAETEPADESPEAAAEPTESAAAEEPTAAVEEQVAHDTDGTVPVEGDAAAEAHAQPDPDAAAADAAEAKTGSDTEA